MALESALTLKEKLGFSAHILVPKPSASSTNDSLKQVVFLGDSFAKTSYAEEGYPEIFKTYFERHSYSFQDLSKDGSNFNYHKAILDSIDQQKTEMVIYFYNISDILSLDQSLFRTNNADLINLTDDPQNPQKIVLNKKKSKKNKKRKNLNSIIRTSKSFELCKDALHQLFVFISSKPTPGSNLYKYNGSHMNYKGELADYFNSLTCDNILIVVNYPVNFDNYHTRKWEIHHIFQTMNLNNNIHILQINDVELPANASVSWRNSHPNQASIRAISTYILDFIEQNKLVTE